MKNSFQNRGLHGNDYDNTKITVYWRVGADQFTQYCNGKLTVDKIYVI